MKFRFDRTGRSVEIISSTTSKLNLQEIHDKLCDIFKDNGIILFPDEYDEPLTIDSLRFISIIVEIEEKFELIIPDEFFMLESRLTFNLVKSIVETLVN